MVVDRCSIACELDTAVAQNAQQTAPRDLKRPGFVGGARCGLRIRGGSGGCEPDVAVGMLDDLMDVPVEHRYRIEAAQRRQDARAVLRRPAPRRKERVERNVGEDDNGRRAILGREILVDEIELLGAELPVDLEVEDVDEREEVHAALIPGRPALRSVAFAESCKEYTRRPNDVVLPGENDERSLERAEYLLGGIELRRLRKVGDVARMNDEGWLHGHRVDRVDGLLKRPSDIRVFGVRKADMTIADLHE